MKIRGVGRLRQEIRRVQKRLAPSKGLILMYHSIAEEGSDPWKLCVSPQNFAQHLEVLRKYAHPISLRQLAQARQEGTIPHRAVALTFDDGYANNFYNAKPLLEQYNIPATVFVTTGYIGRDREFWWDELEKALLKPGKLPEKLCLPFNGSTYEWELGEATDYTQEDSQRDRNCKHWEARSRSRLALYYAVWQKLQPLPDVQQQEALTKILSWSGTKDFARPTYRILKQEELHQLRQGDLVEIGAHTVTHPFLSAHSPDFQWNEIQRSKNYLEEKLECPVVTFAYPYGNYTPETAKLAKKAGFDCACSTVEDIVWRESDPFQLPRFEVGNWNGEEFTKRLWGWFQD